MSIAKPGTNLVIDYWPSWSDDWERNKLRSTPDRVDVINISFALPDRSGKIVWTDDINPPRTKEVIRELQAKGKRITIAVGGATAHDWNLESMDAIKVLAKNIKAFVDEYGLNGVDLDYEMLDPVKRARMALLIKELRTLMPSDRFLITYAAWSIGAFGAPGHEHPEWGVNKGIDIPVLREAGHLLDWVNVMSYDVFDKDVKPGYDPREAIEAYRSLMGSADKVVLGVLIGDHSWPKDVRTSTATVRPWMEYAVREGFRGVMFWTLSFDVTATSGERPGAFMALTEEVWPRGKRDEKLRGDLKAEVERKHKGAAAAAAAAAPGSAAVAAAAAVAAGAAAAGAGAGAPRGAAAPAPAAGAAGAPAAGAAGPAVVRLAGAGPLPAARAEGAGIGALSEMNQKKIRDKQIEQESQIKKIEQEHAELRKKRGEILAKATPSQIEGLTGQYRVHDKQLDDHLQAVKAALKGQLDYLIEQLRNDEINRRKP